MSAFTSYEEVKHYLYSLRHHGAKYGIDRIRLLAAEIGHPERQFPSIHVAGTNGKGSVCAMLEAIYRESGLKTGLSTSPHLVFQGERIQVNRQILDHRSIVGYTERLKEISEKLAAVNPDDHPSFFEFMTAMAFLRFAEEKVDIGIIETGLGGRLDASNIVSPEVSVITSISLDHCAILGDSLEKIAYEKAGIIKEDRPVVIGRLPAEAEAAIRSVAKERNSPVHSIREEYGDDPSLYPQTNLAGDYQRNNAATASLAVKILQDRFPVTDGQRLQALQNVYWPARWEAHSVGGKTLILDTSHNAEGASMLDKNLEKLARQTGRKPIILVGTLGQDHADALMPMAARHARKIILLKPAQPRAASFSMLEEALPKGFTGPVSRSTVKTLFPFPGCCTAGDEDDTLVATGSIYLMGEIFEALYHEVPVREHVLQ